MISFLSFLVWWLVTCNCKSKRVANPEPLPIAMGSNPSHCFFCIHYQNSIFGMTTTFNHARYTQHNACLLTLVDIIDMQIFYTLVHIAAQS